jgi:hypothetical protein
MSAYVLSCHFIHLAVSACTNPRTSQRRERAVDSYHSDAVTMRCAGQHLLARPNRPLTKRTCFAHLTLPSLSHTTNHQSVAHCSLGSARTLTRPSLINRVASRLQAHRLQADSWRGIHSWWVSIQPLGMRCCVTQCSSGAEGEDSDDECAQLQTTAIKEWR